MTKGSQTNKSPQKNNDFNNKLKALEARVNILEEKNKSLESKVEVLESRNAVCEKVNTELSKELDRLCQYTRRSNVVLKNVFLPENETNDDITKVVTKVIAKDLQLATVTSDIDKLHRIGKVKVKDGKKIKTLLYGLRVILLGTKYLMRGKRRGT